MDLPKIYQIYNLVKGKVVRATIVTFNKGEKYSSEKIVEPLIREQIKEKVVLNKNIIIFTEKKEEKQKSSTILIIIV